MTVQAGQTGASGDRLKEGCAINKSLPSSQGSSLSQNVACRCQRAPAVAMKDLTFLSHSLRMNNWTYWTILISFARSALGNVIEKLADKVKGVPGMKYELWLSAGTGNGQSKAKC